MSLVPGRKMILVQGRWQGAVGLCFHTSILHLPTGVSFSGGPIIMASDFWGNAIQEDPGTQGGEKGVKGYPNAHTDSRIAP